METLDRLPSDQVPTWEDWALDLEVVLDASDSQSTALMAVADGGGQWPSPSPRAIPERVGCVGAVQRVGDLDLSRRYRPSSPKSKSKPRGARLGWRGRHRASFKDPIQSEWFAQIHEGDRHSPRHRRSEASNLVCQHRFCAAFGRCTDTGRPPDAIVGSPTVEAVRQLTEHFPNARFVDIPGTDLTPPRPSNQTLFLATVQEFLTGVRPSPTADRFLATVLFTDIVDSTRVASTIGDRAWHEILDAHDEMIRAELERCRGREVKTTGDGFLAIFDGPSRAIECALGIRDHARGIGIEVPRLDSIQARSKPAATTSEVSQCTSGTRRSFRTCQQGAGVANGC